MKKKLLTLMLMTVVVFNLMVFANGKQEPEDVNFVLDVTKEFYFGDATDNPDLKEEYLSYFEEQFGIKLNVNSPPRNSYVEKINLMIASGDLKGMVHLFSPADIQEAIEQGTILPLDDLLKDNADWNAMPDSYKEIYKYNGQTWAIPMGYKGYWFGRTWRQDWLDNLGLPVPETIEQLYETARAFTEDDPDGNGIDDTVGITSAGTWNLQDIFQAFDCKLNNIGEGPYNWDPKTNNWEDGVLEPGMADALAFLNDLYSKGYLDKEFMTNRGSNMRENIYAGKAGSTFYWGHWGMNDAGINAKKNDPNANFVVVPATKGTRTTQLNQRVIAPPIYSLLAGTDDPEKTVNTFFNIFQIDPKGHRDGMFGIEGKTYTYNEASNTITRMINTSTEKAYDQPGLGDHNQFLSHSNHTIVEDGADKNDYWGNWKIIGDRALENELLYDCPNDAVLSPTLTMLNADVQRIFNDTISKAIIGEWTVDKALDFYRTEMKKLGAQTILDEVNAAYGMKGHQQY